MFLGIILLALSFWGTALGLIYFETPVYDMATFLTGCALFVGAAAQFINYAAKSGERNGRT